MQVMICDKSGWIFDPVKILDDIRLPGASVDNVLTNARKGIATGISANCIEFISRKTLITSHRSAYFLSYGALFRLTYSTEIRWRNPGQEAVTFSAWKQVVVIFGHDGSVYGRSSSCCERTRSPKWQSIRMIDNAWDNVMLTE
jgi:hypothetical protein